MPKEYVSEKYKDFAEKNVVWCFDDKSSTFKKFDLKNLVYGDTDSAYLKISDTASDFDVNSVVEVADDVVKSVDARFPDFLKNAFNCPKERLQTIKTDREVVSDKSFFVTKKRYAMHIIDDEGKRVDKLKIMGLEVKKSDTSKAVKGFLQTCIKMIIDGCNRKQLIEYKNEFKAEFYTLSISDIGVPMPAAKLGDYENEFSANGSMKGFPYHYRAAIFYNDCCTTMDRKIYAGEKFFVCNIKHMESKYIGLPVTLNKIPQFVQDVVIDYDVMWAKADKKINNYMKSLGWDIEGVLKKQSNDLFGC